MPESKPLSRAVLVSHREILIAYLKVKIDHDDFHAVSDVANDIRELDVKIAGLR